MDAWPRGFAQASAASSQAAQIPGFKTPNVMPGLAGQHNKTQNAKQRRSGQQALLPCLLCALVIQLFLP